MDGIVPPEETRGLSMSGMWKSVRGGTKGEREREGSHRLLCPGGNWIEVLDFSLRSPFADSCSRAYYYAMATL